MPGRCCIPVIRRAVKTSGRALKRRIHQPCEAIASSEVQKVLKYYWSLIKQFLLTYDWFVLKSTKHEYWYLVIFDLHLLPAGIIGGGCCRWAHRSWWKLVYSCGCRPTNYMGITSWVWNIFRCLCVGNSQRSLEKTPECKRSPPSQFIDSHPSLKAVFLSFSKIHTFAVFAPALHWVKISWGPASLSSACVRG